MIDDASLTALIRETLPDAQVRIADLTGTMDHFEVLVRSNAFEGKSLMDRHRLVERALKPARDDGRIHALAHQHRLFRSKTCQDAIRSEIDPAKSPVTRSSSTAREPKRMPRCGFTLETIQFFSAFGYPFEVIDVLERTCPNAKSWPR